MKESREVITSISNLVLGAGLAGMSAAYHSDAIIYESEESPGGAARSININGFTFDLGIHVLHTSNPIVLSLLNEIGAELLLVERNAWIYSHKSLTRFPFQANTFGLPANIIKDCLLGFIDNNFNDKSKVANYHDWLLYMFGSGYVKHFMLPYAKKFWGVEAHDLTTDWVNVRHPRPSLDEVLTGALMDQTKGFGVNATFRYPQKGGYGHIASQFAKSLQGRIVLKKKATKILPEQKIVEFNDGTKIKYNNLFSTLALENVLNLLDNVPSNVLNASKKLISNTFVLVKIGVERANISDKSWIYYSDNNISFVRISFPHNMSSDCVPDGCSSILVEISYGPYDTLPNPIDSIIPKVLDDLISVQILNTEDNILFADPTVIQNAYVVFDHNRKAAISTIHSYLESVGITPFGRYGMWDYLWSDEAIINGRKVGKLISSKTNG